jgi:hypothetical protein
MRIAPILLILAMSAPAMAADRSPAAKVTQPAPHCARTSSYLADKSSLYHGGPLAPRKLTELPPAVGYMAVYRQIGGCDAPLTMVEYRRVQRR